MTISVYVTPPACFSTAPEVHTYIYIYILSLSLPGFGGSEEPSINPTGAGSSSPTQLLLTSSCRRRRRQRGDRSAGEEDELLWPRQQVSSRRLYSSSARVIFESISDVGWLINCVVCLTDAGFVLAETREPSGQRRARRPGTRYGRRARMSRRAF